MEQSYNLNEFKVYPLWEKFSKLTEGEQISTMIALIFMVISIAIIVVMLALWNFNGTAVRTAILFFIIKSTIAYLVNKSIEEAK